MPDRLTEAEAKALYDTGWWEGLPAEEVFKFQLYNRLAMPFEEFHKATEEALGRPVWTHEFASPDRLMAEFTGEEPTPEDPNQHALDSLAALLLSHGKDPDECMIVVNLEADDADRR